MPRRELRLEVRVLERVAVPLVDDGLGAGLLELVDVLPLVAALGQLVGGVLDPDDRDVLRSGLVHERADVADHVVTLVGVRDHAVLHVDHHEGRVRPVRQGRHVASSGWVSHPNERV